MTYVNGAEFAREAGGIKRAAVTMARNRGYIIQEIDGTYDLDHPDNAAYILKQLLNKSRREHRKLEKLNQTSKPKSVKKKTTQTKKPAKIKPEPKKKETKPKKSNNSQTKKEPEKPILSEIEIFIQALSGALEESEIPSKDQSSLKRSMIKKADEIELSQSESPFNLENKPYKNKIITDTATIKKYEKSLFPKKGNHVFFITTSSMNASAFLLFAAKNIGIIEEIYMSYFRISKFSVNILEDLIEKGFIKKCYVLISELSTRDASTSKDNLDNLIKLFPDRVAVGTVQTHTKIMSMKIGLNYYTVSSSANITVNARVEQYSVFNDKKLFEYNKNWILSPEEYLHQRDSVHFGNMDIFK